MAPLSLVYEGEPSFDGPSRTGQPRCGAGRHFVGIGLTLEQHQMAPISGAGGLGGWGAQQNSEMSNFVQTEPIGAAIVRPKARNVS